MKLLRHCTEVTQRPLLVAELESAVQSGDDQRRQILMRLVGNQKIYPLMYSTSLKAAFSLIEITLALGIISFAFIALLGMIPLGLNSFATAIDSTVETQIMQRVTTIARQANFSKLSEINRNPGKKDGEEEPDFFFDEQANEVVKQDAISAGDYVYTAAVTILDRTEVPSSAGSLPNSNLTTLNIYIKRVSAPKEEKVVSLLIANNGL